MRQIKFRIWNITGKEMIYPDLYWFEEEGIREVPGDAYGYQVMQFIDRQDKNGKDIYEGDIVKYDPIDAQGVVTWVNTGLGFIAMPPEKNGVYVIHDGWEIIGNIYEHPELLQQQGGTP